jgi:hypothetical protein
MCGRYVVEFDDIEIRGIIRVSLKTWEQKLM